MADENKDMKVEEEKVEKVEEQKEEEKEEEKVEEKKEEEKEEEVKDVPILGVDFGSNASVVSKTFLGSTKLPTIVQNRISNASTPTEVGFRENQRLFGEDCYTNDPENTVNNLKPLLGAKLSALEGEKPFHLAPVVEGQEEVTVKVKYCGEEKQFSADKLVGMVMKQLVGSAKGIEEGIPVVMSVPRVWGEEEIASLRKAAKIAGVNLAGCVSDLTAAALVYAYTRKRDDSIQDILFVDMGKTYFQLQIVRFSGKKCEILAHHSEQLGGRDFTHRLQTLLSEEIAQKYKLDVTKRTRNVWQMNREAQRLKKVLSTVPLVKFEYFIMDTDVSIPCPRAKFEERCHDLLARIQPAVEKVIGAAKEALKEKEEEELKDLSLEIIGGGLIIPAVLSRIKAAVGVSTERRSLDSQSCRSLGAGLFTALFFKGGEWKFAEEGGEYVLVDKEGEEMVGWFEGEVGEVEKGVKEELEMCKRDEEVAALATKRNEVEETIFKLRDRITQSPEEVGLKGDVVMKDKLLAVLKETEDWLLYDEEADNATMEVFQEKLTHMDTSMKEISPKFYQYLEDLEIEKKKMEEKARQDAEELQARPIRDKTERPLKKAEFIAASEKRKQQGNMAIKEDDYDGAIVRYKQALANFSQIREELTEEEEKQATLIKLGCYLNMALCYLKSPGREAKVIQNCEEALALDGENVKALFRRGSALAKQKEWNKAKADFDVVLKKDPKNKAAAKQLAFVEKKIQEQKDKEKKMCAKMFG